MCMHDGSANVDCHHASPVSRLRHIPCVRCCCMVMESMRASCPRSASSLSTSKCWYLQGEATDVLCHARAKWIFFGTPLSPFVLICTHCYHSSLCALTVTVRHYVHSLLPFVIMCTHCYRSSLCALTVTIRPYVHSLFLRDAQRLDFGVHQLLLLPHLQQGPNRAPRGRFARCEQPMSAALFSTMCTLACC